MLEIIDQGVLSQHSSKGTFCPSIIQLRDGSLLAADEVASGLGAADARIEVLHSDDLGRTWHNLGNIHGNETDDAWSYRVPDIEELPDGRLLMAATRIRASAEPIFDPQTETLQRPELLLFWSDDQGRSWTAPQVVPVHLPPEKYTWNKAGRLRRFSSTRWMFPFETWKPEEWDGPPDQKAAAIFSRDRGRTWGGLTAVADDGSGRLLWWDQQHIRLPDGRVYTLLWTHRYGTSDDLPVHWVISEDEGATWSQTVCTNLRGQLCCPVALADGRVAAVYNYRHEPQGVRVAISDDLTTFDLENEITIFDTATEATLGVPKNENFMTQHMLIGFAKPGGILLNDGTIMASFFCTVAGVTHTRWGRLQA